MDFTGFHTWGREIPRHKAKAKLLTRKQKKYGRLLHSHINTMLGEVLSYYNSHDDEATAFYLVLLAEEINEVLNEGVDEEEKERRLSEWWDNYMAMREKRKEKQ